MKEDNNISPRRAKFACRPRAGRRDLLIASEDIADRAEELRATAKGSASDHIVKACAYRLNRTVIIARERGEISPEEAASYATYGREILESGGHEEPQSIVTESLLLYHLRQNREAAAVDDSIQRLKSLASRLQAKVDDAAKSGPVPPDLSWDASLVWAACARVADLSRDADDALGYVRLAIGLTWQDHPRAYAVYVEVLRRILFERGETVLATALPRIVRTDLG